MGQTKEKPQTFGEGGDMLRFPQTSNSTPTGRKLHLQKKTNPVENKVDDCDDAGDDYKGAGDVCRDADDINVGEDNNRRNLQVSNTQKPIRKEKLTNNNGGKLILVEKHLPNMMRYLDAQYQMYLTEVMQLTANTQKSCDTNMLHSGCFRCDARMKPMVSTPIQGNLELSEKVHFVPPTIFNKGYFVCTRNFNGKFQFLPSGEQAAKVRTYKLLERINRSGHAIPREASHKLQLLYAEGGLSWASKFDRAQKNTFLGLLAILRPESKSSPVRICCAPNSQFPTQIGSLSFNMCIHSLTVANPQLYRFQLLKLLSTSSVISDVSQQFPSIHLDYESSINCMYFCYKDPSGWPTYVKQDSLDGELHAIKNSRLTFGTSDAPCIAQYCMLKATDVYLEYHPHLSPTLTCVANMVKEILYKSCWADDIQASTTINNIIEYCRVEKKRTPKKATVLDQCLEGEVCINEKFCWTESSITQYRDYVDGVTEELMLSIAKMLVEILNFCGFSLKFLHGEKHLQGHLDQLTASQSSHQTKEVKVMVTRPENTEVYEHMLRLGKNKDFTSFQPERSSETKTHEIQHLGQVYDDSEIGLKMKSLTFIYSDGKSNQRSPEIFSFDQFEDFMSKCKPILTRRSAFSLVAQNCDISGRWLCLFKAQIKVAIRLFLKNHSEQNNLEARWEEKLDLNTIHRIKIAIKSYFYLVKQKLPQVDLFKYNTHQLYLVGTSDGAENLFTISTTVVARICLNGIVSSKAVHLTLHPFSVNVNILCMISIEMLAMIRLISEMELLLTEMASLGTDIPYNNRIIFTDSKILATLIRQKIHLLKRKFAHGVAKIQIKLADLKMSPYTSVALIQQDKATLWTDFYSKFNSLSLDSIVHKHKRIFDMSWIESAHPRKLNGISFDSAVPSGAELKYISDNAVLEGEMVNIENNIKTNTGNDFDQLLSAAASLCTNTSDRWEECEIEEDIAKFGENNKNLLLQKAVPVHSWANMTIAKDDMNDLNLSEIRFDDNQRVDDKQVSSESQVKSDEGEEVSKDDRNDLNSSEIRFDDNQRVDDKQVSSESKVKSDEGERVSITSRKAAICVADEPGRVWRAQLDHLMSRKRSYGLGERGVLNILLQCQEFIRKCRESSQKGATWRKERQIRRQEEAQERKEQRKGTSENYKKSEDLHDIPVVSVDLMNSDLGQFDDLIEKEGVEEKKKDLEEDEERRKGRRKIFHHLATVYQSEEPERGYNQKKYRNTYGGEIILLEGRKHREFKEKVLRRTRIRKIEAGCEFEELLLSACHASVKGQNLPKAELCLTNLQILITNAKSKLQKLQHICSSCRVRRALNQRQDDLVKKIEKGPQDYLCRSLKWRGGSSTAVLDCLGPLQCYGTVVGSEITKIFAVVIIELPLKTCHILPLKSYSTEDFLIAMRTYINRRMQPMELYVGDAASNFLRLQNSSPGFLPEEETYWQSEKIKLFKEMETGDKRRRLENAGLFIRAPSGHHEMVSVTEKAVATVKEVIRGHGRSMRAPLTIFQWEFLWSQIILCIASRPIHSSKDGKLYTAMSLLSAMGQCGQHFGDDQLQYDTEGDDEVSERLKEAEEDMMKIKEEVSDVLLQVMIEPSYLNQQTRKEEMKRRDSAESAQLNTVYFCPRLFQKTCNFTGSLLRLCRIGLSRQHGLFQKTGPIKKSSFVTRALHDLYLIALPDTDQVLGGDIWLPTWNLKKAKESYNLQRGFIRWEEEDKLDMDKKMTEKKVGETEAEETTRENVRKKRKQKKKAGEIAEDEAKKSEDTSKQSEDTSKQKQIFTRTGRLVKPPKRYQN